MSDVRPHRRDQGINMAASDIARRFGNRQCVACVTELATQLPGTVLEIDVRKNTSKISHIVHAIITTTESISETGLHYGFLHDGLVYDNLSHEGVPEAEWISNLLYFHKSTGKETPVKPEDVNRLTATQFLQRSK